VAPFHDQKGHAALLEYATVVFFEKQDLVVEERNFHAKDPVSDLIDRLVPVPKPPILLTFP